MKLGTIRIPFYELSEHEMRWLHSALPLCDKIATKINAMTDDRKEFAMIRDEVICALSRGCACLTEENVRCWE